MTASQDSSVARPHPQTLTSWANRTGGNNVSVNAKQLLALLRDYPQMMAAREVGLVLLWQAARAEGHDRAKAVDVAASFQVGEKAQAEGRATLNLLLGRGGK